MQRRPTVLTISSGRATSERAFPLYFRLRSGSTAVAGEPIRITWRADRGQSHTVALTTDRRGIATTTATGWKRVSINATHATTARWSASSRATTITARPLAPVITSPRGLPTPTNAFPDRPRAVGAGAHAAITSIPDSVWRRMQGRSWSQGCRARSRLRYIEVNYWGFDGYRHRGELVVASSVAARVAAAFTSLYDQQYPIRQMRLPDDFGAGPYKGANDYRSMAADNTSAFNCRYVVGAEPERIMSPHATGLAVDINPWENPYVSRRGVYPNHAWLSRRINHPAVFSGYSDPAVRALTSRGLRWGGGYADFHHYED